MDKRLIEKIISMINENNPLLELCYLLCNAVIVELIATLISMRLQLSIFIFDFMVNSAYK